MLLYAKDVYSRLLLPKRKRVIISTQQVQQTPNSSATSSNNKRRHVNKGQYNDRLGAIVQISAHGLIITSTRHNNSCHVKVGKLSGCYSCTRGSMTNLSCTSSVSEETAQVECQNITQLVKCTPEGTISTLRFHFSNSNIDLNCSVRCSGSTSSISLRGQLSFVNEGVFLSHVVSMNTSLSSGTILNNYPFSSIFTSMRNFLSVVSNFFNRFKMLLC